MKILIAEDDPVSRRLLEVFLAKWGYEVIVSRNGEEAWHAFGQEEAPRLALLDWMMPGMTGVELCRKIRERAARPYTYILLLTAKSQKQDLLEGLAAGADDYLSKPFDADELRARLQVGQRIIALQDSLIATQEALRFQATHDALTELVNRAEILEVLRRELRRNEREGGGIGVVLADLDHFKNVNDSYGHLSGDAVLRETARRMTASVRAYDSVGRYGGEEFLLVVPAADAAGTLGLAERIRAAVAGRPYQTPGGGIALTVSLGVLAVPGSETAEVQTVLRTADAALYHAKARGRNRVEMAAPEGRADSNAALEKEAVPSKTQAP